MIAGWAISDQRLERPEKQCFGGLLKILFQHDATIGGTVGGDEDTKLCVYGLSMTI